MTCGRVSHRKDKIMKRELVRDWMTHEVITASPETSIIEADKLMIDHTIRRLPVVDQFGKLVGIVTYGDVREARPSSATSLSVWELNYLISRLTLAEIMTPSPITISPDSTIAEAASAMLKHMISALPVVDHKGHLVGILTESDIFRMVVHDWMHNEDEKPEPFTHYNNS